MPNVPNIKKVENVGGNCGHPLPLLWVRTGCKELSSHKPRRTAPTTISNLYQIFIYLLYVSDCWDINPNDMSTIFGNILTLSRILFVLACEDKTQQLV
jgi:hypothetical protein